jgi:hypothetical protein
MIEQARYHDVGGIVSDGPGKKPRSSWVRLPPGWERCQEGSKSFYYIDRNTGMRYADSPVRDQPPPPPQPIHLQRICPDGWENTWDNLGRMTMKYNTEWKTRAQAQKMPQGLQKLPSWVPNWAAKTAWDPAPLLNWSETEPLYLSGGKSLVVLHQSKSAKCLILEGVEFDQIFCLGDAWHPLPGEKARTRKGLQALESWERLSTINFLSSHCPYGGGSSRKEAFWRTHIADYPGDKAATNSFGWAIE